MSTDRPLVLAVFGRNQATPAELDIARRYGAAIGRSGALLLTGGVGTGAPEIKEQAIQGAVASTGPGWIGVANGHVLAAPTAAHGGGLVLHPGVGHRRNFLGACLCDAAVVLPGRQGTSGELLFALALGRPVVLVGREPQAWADLRAEAQERVPRPDGPATLLDRAIAAAYEVVPPAAPASVPLHMPVEQVVAKLLFSIGSPLAHEDPAQLTDQSAWDALLRDRAASLLDGGRG